MRKELIFIVFILVFSGCKKNEVNPVDLSLEDLVVDDNFTWETSMIVDFNLLMPLSGIVMIAGENSQTVYYRGYNNRLNEDFHVSVRIPSNIRKVLVNGKPVDLNSTNIVVDLTDMTGKLKNGSMIRGMVSWWPLNENIGTVANDQTGGNHGTIHNATWQSGIEGSSLEFNGTDAWVEIPEATNLDILEAITLCAWVKTRENVTMKIAQKGDWDGYGLGQSKWTGWNASIKMADQSEHQLYWSQGIPLLNEWYFLAMTYNGAEMKFYVNGQVKASTPVTGLLRNNNRGFSIGSDWGVQKFCNGFIDEVSLYNHALSGEDIFNLYQNFPNEDTDGDGVLNVDDDYPEDPLRAFNNYFPADGNGSLAFEDMWPDQGDYDFNDLVLDYQFQTVTNANNFVTEINARFVIKAIGAGYKNGFGFQFNQNFPADQILVTGSELTENFISLETNGSETGQDKTTIIVFDNASNHLDPQGGTGVNVNHDFAYSQPDTIHLTINFTDDVYTALQISPETWNPFLIVNKIRGREVHLANHAPTSIADLNLLGTSDDHSIPASGIYYKTSNNLPWAIEIPVSFDYPVEKASIADAHLKFINWAASAGNQYTDWYMNLPGYRQAEKIY